MKTKNELKRYFGVAAKLLIAAAVFSFLALLSWQFFTFIFPADRWFYAFLGFSLTGGGAVGYFVVIKSGDADTHIRRMIALIMLILCAIGEVITAGYGMQVESMIKQGQTVNPGFLDFMITAVQVLAFVHALALFLWYLWDDVRLWFADENKNGIPDGLERAMPTYRFVGQNQDVKSVKLSDNGRKQPDFTSRQSQQD